MLAAGVRPEVHPSPRCYQQRGDRHDELRLPHSVCNCRWLVESMHSGRHVLTGAFSLCCTLQGLYVASVSVQCRLAQCDWPLTTSVLSKLEETHVCGSTRNTSGGVGSKECCHLCGYDSHPHLDGTVKLFWACCLLASRLWTLCPIAPSRGRTNIPGALNAAPGAVLAKPLPAVFSWAHWASGKRPKNAAAA